MFDGPIKDPHIPDKLDPRIAAGVIMCLVVGVLTIVGDQVAFVRPHSNVLELIIAVPTILCAMVLGDRMYANGGAAVFWCMVVFSIGMLLYTLLVRYVIEPMAVKNMIAAKRREKELLNRYEDDTL